MTRQVEMRASWSSVLSLSVSLSVSVGARGTCVRACPRVFPLCEQAHVDSWASVFVLVLAATMNQGAIDSLQNGLLSGLFFLLPRCHSLGTLRLAGVAISGLLVIIALQDLPVLEIFLATNMVCTSSFLPFVLGAWWDSPSAQECITERVALLSIACAVSAVSVTGVAAQWGVSVGRGVVGDVMAGLWFAWMGHGYSWLYFAVASGSSLLVLAGAACYHLCKTSPQPLVLRLHKGWGAGRRASGRGQGAGVSLRPSPLLGGVSTLQPSVGGEQQQVCLLELEHECENTPDSNSRDHLLRQPAVPEVQVSRRAWTQGCERQGRHDAVFAEDDAARTKEQERTALPAGIADL